MSPFMHNVMAMMGAQRALTDKVSFNTVCLFGEKLTPDEMKELVDYLLWAGAKWTTNEQSYAEMSEPNTYYLWLRNNDIQLCCGFSFHGDYPKNYAFGRFIQRG